MLKPRSRCTRVKKPLVTIRLKVKVTQQGGGQLTIGLLNALIARPHLHNLVPLLLPPSLAERMLPRAVSGTVLQNEEDSGSKNRICVKLLSATDRALVSSRGTVQMHIQHITLFMISAKPLQDSQSCKLNGKDRFQRRHDNDGEQNHRGQTVILYAKQGPGHSRLHSGFAGLRNEKVMCALAPRQTAEELQLCFKTIMPTKRKLAASDR